MDLHRGRLIDHVHLRARDLAASRRFYAAILDVLGIPVVSDDKHLAADELWIDAGDAGSRVHLAFQTDGRAMVDKAWRAGLEAGRQRQRSPGRAAISSGLLRRFPPRSRRQQHRSGLSRSRPALRRQRQADLLTIFPI